MQAIILAAGLGNRLRPITNNMPKPLVKVRGKPLLAYHLEKLHKAGCSKVVINLHYLGEQIRDYCATQAYPGMEILFSEEEQILETGGGITRALPLLDNHPFIVLSSDIYTSYDFTALPTAPNGLAHLVMVDNPQYHPQGDYGMQADKLHLTATPRLTYANIGVYRPEFFCNPPAENYKLNIKLREHIAAGQVTAEHYHGEWHNIGRPEDLELVNSPDAILCENNTEE